MKPPPQRDYTNEAKVLSIETMFFDFANILTTPFKRSY